MAEIKGVELLGISVRGVVQGVGFRPFVYQLATEHGLKGWVCNTSGDVKIEVEGEGQALERFVTELETQAPPLARIESITTTPLKFVGYTDFHIRHSIAEADKYQPVSPDIATCQPCLREVFDPRDRRYRYPFTDCTSCGPRFTIIEDIPYDRPLTTMRQGSNQRPVRRGQEWHVRVRVGYPSLRLAPHLRAPQKAGMPRQADRASAG